MCIYQDYGDACSKVFVEMHIMEDELVLVPTVSMQIRAIDEG